MKEINTPGNGRDENKHDRCMVELRQVVKTFAGPAGVFHALRGVDLFIRAGEFVSIIGKSGSGKSTLINMITGIDRPTQGAVLVDGVSVHALDEEQIAVWRGAAIGIIFQFFQLLPTLTAVENVLLAMDYGRRYPLAQRPDRAMQLLDRMGAADCAHEMPLALSGGQQQLVAIARALANDPPLLAADEPTGNLDSQTAELVIRRLQELAGQGKTILIVTHDDDLARQAHRTILIADGRIAGERANRG